MDKRIVLGGVGVVVVAVAIAAAQMVPSSEEAPADMVTDANDNPFEGLDQVYDEEGPDLGMTDEEIKAEDDFLQISPDSAGGTDTEPSTALTENVRYTSCSGRHSKTVPGFMDSTLDAAAKRSISLYLAYENVIETKDCSCAGKVMPFSEVEAVISAIEEEQGDDWNRSDINDEYKSKYRGLRDQIEQICGGDF